jgi:hypothetical protein
MSRADYTHKMVNGERVALTEDEINECVAREEAWAAGASVRALEAIRNERNSRIAATDYLALSDQTMSAEMTAYRQALRDVPSTDDPVGFMASWNEFQVGADGAVDPWPSKPNG